MNKQLFVLLILIIAFDSNAQIKLGLRVAPQLTWSKHENKTTTTNGTRVNAGYGLMIDYYFTDNYSISTEFTIQSMATNLNLSNSKFDSVILTTNNKVTKANEDLKYDYKMRYIQVPVLLKMRTNKIGALRYYAEFGASLSMLTRARANISMGNFELDNVNVNKPDDDDEFSIKPNDYEDGIRLLRTGLVIGGGIQYELFGNSLLVAGIRFDNGLNSYTRDDKWEARLSYIALNIGILF